VAFSAAALQIQCSSLQTADEVRARAEKFVGRIDRPAELVPGESVIGGGATPERSIPTWLVAIAIRDLAERSSAYGRTIRP
jgi:hypothetical protein